MTIDNILTEGIKTFKYSDRIGKYLKKITKKSSNSEELDEVIAKLKSLQKEFKKVEIKFKEAKSKDELKEIKKEWEILKVKNEKMINLIKKDEVKKAAIIAGVFALIIAFLLLIKKGIDFNLNKIEEQKEVVPKIEDKSNENYKHLPKNIEHDEDGVRKIPEQVHNPNLNSPEEFYKGFKMPEPSDYSKQDLIKILSDECKKQKFPFEIAKEVAKAESGVDARAISPDGDSVGLLQLNTVYTDEFAKKWYKGTEEFNPFNPKHNAEAGIRYLRFLIKDNNGDLRQALLDYNAGPNRSKTTNGTLRYADRIVGALATRGVAASGIIISHK